MECSPNFKTGKCNFSHLWFLKLRKIPTNFSHILVVTCVVCVNSTAYLLTSL
jgi:hypothetical protein